MSTYHSKLNLFMILPQATTVGLTEGTPAEFAASGSGSTTTVVAAALTAATDTDDDVVGYLVECVSAAASAQRPNVGQFRKVEAFATATGTATCEKFPAATETGDRFRLWIPPAGWWSSDATATAGAAGVIHDAIRDEAVDFFAGSAEEGGPYLMPVAAGALPSTTLPIITNSSNGYVKTASWGAALAVGDLVQAVYFPELVSPGMFELAADPIRRAGPVGSYGEPEPVRGNRVISGSIEMAFRGPGAARIGSHAEAHMLLKTVCDVVDPADATIDTGSTTTNVTIASGTPVAGSMYVTEAGSLAMCTLFSAPDTTVSPALVSAPVATDTLYGCTTYKPSTGLNEAVTVVEYRGDGFKQELYGCAPALSFSGARGDWLKIMAAFQGTDGYQVGYSSAGTAIARPFRAKRSTINQQRIMRCRAVLGATVLDLASFTIDLGQAVVAKAGLRNSNEQGGLDLTNDVVTGQIVALMNTDVIDQIARFTAGEPIELFIQCGAAPGYPGIFGLWAYKASYTGSQLADLEGQVQVTLPFLVHEDPTETTLPRWAIGIA